MPFQSLCVYVYYIIWAPPSEFVSSSIPSWQILTAHAQPFRGARDLAFCLKVPLDSLLVWASSEGSGETARMRRLAWTFAARIGDKYQIRLARPIYRQHRQTVINKVWKIVGRHLKNQECKFPDYCKMYGRWSLHYQKQTEGLEYWYNLTNFRMSDIKEKKIILKNVSCNFVFVYRI